MASPSELRRIDPLVEVFDDNLVRLMSRAYDVADHLSDFGWQNFVLGGGEGEEPTRFEHFPHRPDWIDDGVLELARRHRRGEALDDTDRKLLRRFGDFRVLVTQLEGLVAKRIAGLCWTARTLAEHEPAGARLELVRRFLRSVYRIDNVPDALDVRAFADSHSRRYDVLPVAWRAA